MNEPCPQRCGIETLPWDSLDGLIAARLGDCPNAGGNAAERHIKPHQELRSRRARLILTPSRKSIGNDIVKGTSDSMLELVRGLWRPAASTALQWDVPPDGSRSRSSLGGSRSSSLGSRPLYPEPGISQLDESPAARRVSPSVFFRNSDTLVLGTDIGLSLRKLPAAVHCEPFSTKTFRPKEPQEWLNQYIAIRRKHL